MGDSCHMQLISSYGEFFASDLAGFIKSQKVHECGLSYSVVAIMGPQSSGKSTLLNHLFHTNFEEMNALLGRRQTTRGIWIAKAGGIEPFTLVMDLEGTDGRERGQDDTAFEKQSALFALAVADIVLINMWCHDIGRENASNKPLLKTVFQVMMQLFSPRKTTLLFVIRDKTETPPNILEEILREDIQKIWEAVPKPSEHIATPVTEFFNVEVFALSSKKEEEFKEQVAELRHKYFHSPSPDRRGVVPASGFSLNAENIWKNIKENKDLDLPAFNVMVATVRCEEIANDKFNSLASGEDWLALKKDAETVAVSGFGRIAGSILNRCLFEYDLESIYFEENVRNEKRQYLESKALQLLGSCFLYMLKHLRSDAFEHFKTEVEILVGRGEGFADSVAKCKQASMLKFDDGCSDAAIEQANWNASEVRAELSNDIEEHASRVRDQKSSQVVAVYKNKLSEALSQSVADAFAAGEADTWGCIRSLLLRESDATASAFYNDIIVFDLVQSRVEEMVVDLKEYAKLVVERKSREEARDVLTLMINRFHTSFNHVESTGREDISAITREVHLECLRLLSTMAVLRLDDTTDGVETVIFSELMDINDAIPSKNMASTTWNQVPPGKTLITPAQCNELWMQFMEETKSRVNQAQSAQEVHRRSNELYRFMTTVACGASVIAAATCVSVATSTVGAGATAVRVVEALVKAAGGPASVGGASADIATAAAAIATAVASIFKRRH